MSAAGIRAIAAASAAVLPLAAVGQANGDGEDHEPSPAQYPDDSYISLSGTIVEMGENAFQLDFDGGIVAVEMDDVDIDEDYELKEGDQITVYGEIDENLFEAATIEPARIYVAKLDKYLYTDPAQEPGVGFTGDVDPAVMVVQGTVTDIDGGELTISSGVRSFRVDVEALEDVGERAIRRGDVVAVRGEVDYDFIEGRETEATSVAVVREAEPERFEGH